MQHHLWPVVGEVLGSPLHSWNSVDRLHLWTQQGGLAVQLVVTSFIVTDFTHASGGPLELLNSPVAELRWRQVTRPGRPKELEQG